ncbi:alcohol dehydrogenase [Fusarium albosuccineum]|uniref:Alcohol dehydrogenase n=1 Tax=Fusarium albosuccineum TaxID=1237068 RepID=A0A8H4KEB8_9HYPO|nr:alcohol dehydrogenase [Fusarium albosuccineum]
MAPSPEQTPATMLAWRKHRGSPIPVPASWFQDQYILGHEGCGQIVQLGSAVTNNKLQVGDIVALHAVPGCGENDCPECSRDLSQLCERGHHSGIGQDGFYAPYATIDARGAVKVPEGVTPEEAAVATDAVNTAYHAIKRRGQVKSNETVFLFGLGGLGFNALQILIHIGPRIIVSDIRQERLDEAQRLGIPSCDIVPIGIPPQDFVRKAGLDGRIDTVLDFVGTHQTFEDAQHIGRKRLSFIFSYGGQVKDLEEVLQLIAAGSIRPQVEKRKLNEFPEVLEALGKGEVRARIALTHD